MTVYLGTNFGHGSAAAVISEYGKLLYAAEEGKLTGDKNTRRFPTAALSLAAQYLECGDVVWAEGWNLHQRFIHKGLLRSFRYGWRDKAYFWNELPKELRQYQEGRNRFMYWKRRLGTPRLSGHHLAHAYSLLPAGLPGNSLVFVSDTTAERASIASYYFSGRAMTHITTSLFPHSIGSVFHQLAYHLGFPGRSGPGKLMALSGYGNPRFFEEMKKIGSVENGIFRINLGIYPSWMRNGSWLKFAESVSGEFCAAINQAHGGFDLGVDLAASAQAWFTEITWECIRQTLAIARKKGFEIGHLGLAGGAALNCQANGSFLFRMPDVGINTLTVSPWSDDAGTAIGAAVWALMNQRKSEIVQASSPFLGPLLLADNHVPGNEDVRLTTDCLSYGKVVALASGRLEFGPRALGGRCLLADPRQEESRKKLNRMKSRPDFMPVAPVVLEEDYGRYFSGIGSRHMAWTVPSNRQARKEIPAAVHISGQSRVQVLRKGDAPLLERVLHCFKDKSGHSVLLLTSLNGSEEAIPPNLTDAEAIARRLGADGLLSDVGWVDFREPSFQRQHQRDQS